MTYNHIYFFLGRLTFADDSKNIEIELETVGAEGEPKYITQIQLSTYIQHIANSPIVRERLV